MKYKEISKYPSIKKDLALIVDNNLASQEVLQAMKKSGGSLLTNIEIFDVYTGENIGKDKKSIAYSLTFENQERTLTDEEVNGIFEKIILDVQKKLGVELRK
jgi:phenylalanyl-tRNA synthetase beta chain